MYDIYLPAAFYVRVIFGKTQSSTDTSFQDMSGISPEIDTETVIEGGESRFAHTLREV